MPHLRKRTLEEKTRRISKVWPITGIVGLRQVGKSTLLRERLQVPNHITLDDESALEDASRSAKVFLAKLPTPIVIDEVQKAPNLFDALKVIADKRRIPGQYFLTGSTAFSSRAGVRESLTGRMAVLPLLPLSLCEINGKPFREADWGEVPKARFDTTEFTIRMVNGGMPVPAFFRDPKQALTYWTGWLETTIYRDLPRVFRGRYQPDRALFILREFGRFFREGELPTTSHFSLDARTLRKYLLAMEDIFLVRPIPCHPKGSGREVYYLGDSALVAFLMETTQGEGATLSLARHCLANELLIQLSMMDSPHTLYYFKSHKGTPVDFIWGDHPLKLIAEGSTSGWSERAVHGAMRTLATKKGFMVAPIETGETVKAGIGRVPWSAWG